MAPRAPRRRLSGSARRLAFLDEAAALVAEKGLDALTMEGIAARCGVNKALPYRYFANRDEVLVALFDRETARFDERVLSALSGAKGFRTRLAAIVGVWLDEVERGVSPLAALQDAATACPALAEHRRRRLVATVRFFADLIAAEYALPRKDALVAAAVLLAGSQGLVPAWRATGVSRSRAVETLLRLALGGLDTLRRGA